MWHPLRTAVRLRLRPALAGVSRPGRNAFFTASRAGQSHRNPLGLPGEQPGLPRSGSPPRLNISRSLPTKRDIPHVAKVVVVASGKGGVGKSTVAVNLAISIRNQAALNVGLLDLDIFGPSVPKLMGLEEGLSPELTDQNALVPLRNHGIGCMSIGFLIPPSDSPDSVVAWRGMMVMKAVQQLLFDVDWRLGASTQDESRAGLDVLVIDMPPGTGDVALSLGQLVNIHGAVIVTTPQDIALIDVTKGVNMFRKLNIPIIGSVLNMASFTCTTCQTKHEIFGPMASFERVLARQGVQLLGQIPLDHQISKSSDSGQPISLPHHHHHHHHHHDPSSSQEHSQISLDTDPFIEISRKCIQHLKS
ncbi:hypothetical protein PCANC_09551 [Puccinia coronata f. sp. avenae]|nr:hypothetical protein PCASD_21726 [Puccinia coronata f. sp. avenae]PLW09991.1 hypothetical protein PCANC_19790 [Puccinia coronata f. sp. avenae]PLW29989.1 hypothetical protein PCASD_21758 [Puccinia coronata f. sp. avenae]PLW45071.1 hypothetical protein PCANC_09551 [Puccinia coronata f. sp. avenae]